MIDPKKVYEGINSLLRNIFPGIFILFPILIYSNPSILQGFRWFLVLFAYFIVMFLFHGLLEGAGYYYLKRSNTLKNNELFNKISNEFKIGFFNKLFYPSYFIYVDIITKHINNNLVITAPISFSEYRELQDTKKYRLFFGDHEVFHRINSFMICSDITTYGMIFVSIFISIYHKFMKKYIYNALYDNDHYIFIISIYIISLLMIYFLKLFLSKTLLYIEIYHLFHTGKSKFNELVNDFLNTRNSELIFPNNSGSASTPHN